MSDRILLEGMAFQGTHGVYPEEKFTPQRFEVDVELGLDLAPAGTSDDLEMTVDYGKVFEASRRIVETTQFNLIEALAEAIADAVLADFSAVESIVVRIRKPEVGLGGTFRSVGVEIERRRAS